MHALKPPLDITQSSSRREVLRAWIDKGALSVSLCHQFPEDYKEPQVVWPMLLSDIVHHVVDGISEETGHDRRFVRAQMKESFESVVRSERGSRMGKLKVLEKRLTELPDPGVSGGEDSVEIVRIFLMEESIRVLVFVGMWLPDNEESTWGNLLYDLSYMVALSLKSGDDQTLRGILNTKLVSYIDRPSTEYTGQFYTS